MVIKMILKKSSFLHKNKKHQKILISLAPPSRIAFQSSFGSQAQAGAWSALLVGSPRPPPLSLLQGRAGAGREMLLLLLGDCRYVIGCRAEEAQAEIAVCPESQP